jgi:hypothetical protein
MNEEQYIVFDQYLQGELSREEQSQLRKLNRARVGIGIQTFQNRDN